MELADALKILGTALVTYFLTRNSKGSDDVTELKVKVATLTERLESYAQRLTTVDNRAAAAFAKIDKVRSKMRQDAGKDDHDDAQS